MPSFPLGSPAFPSPSLISDDNHVVVSASQLQAIWAADPTPPPANTPSHFSASPATYAALQLALPTAPMDTNVPSPTHLGSSQTPKWLASVLPSLQIPWSPTLVQPVPVGTLSCVSLCEDPATALGPPAGNSVGSPIVSLTIELDSRNEDAGMVILQPARAPGDWASFPIELSASLEVTHVVSYATPAPTPAVGSLASQDANARDTALATLPACPHLDDVVFDVHDTSEECMADILENRLGYANYVLQEPLSVHSATDINVDLAVLRQAADIVISLLSVGPLDSGGNETDFLRCLSPSSWFRLATATLAGITRSAVRTSMLWACGDFPFQPCLDSLCLPPGAFEPATQSDAIRLLLSQLTQEFDECRNASGLTDKEMSRLDECHWPLFVRELRAKMVDNTTQLCKRVSYYGLVDLATAVHNECTDDELKQIIQDDQLTALRGSEGFNMEL